MASFLCRSCAHEWPQEETDKVYHCPKCGYGYPKDAPRQEAKRLDTLDVLAAIVDAWRRLERARGPMSTTKTFRDLQERDETLEKALEMGRRHLEQEGRL